MTTDGQPVAGARVSVYGFESVEARRARLLSQSPEAVPLASTQTDAKGNFSLASPKDAAVELAILARGFDAVQLRVEREEEAGAIAIRKNEWKSGTVTVGGKPVAGATIAILYNNGFEYVARTGENGRYEAPDPKSARSIAVLHPDYAIDEEMLMLAGTPGAGKLNRTLVTGSQISGQVVGIDGESPVAKAAITLDGWPLATSADDGTFTIAHAAAKWTALIARKDALLGQRSFSKGTSQQVRLARAATISGRILDAKTKLPVPSVLVRTIIPRMAGVEPIGIAISDAKGAFSLVVPPGTYIMMAAHPGYEPNQNDVTAAGGQTASKDLSLTPRARISGVVVDEERKPVVAAIVASEDVSSPAGFPMRMIRMGSTDAATGPDGRFSIRVAADAELRLRVTKKGLPTTRTETMKLAPSERKTGVVLTIPSGVLVTGRVTDAENNPLSGVAVTTAEAEPGRGGPMQRIIISGLQQIDEDAVRTASDGTFSLRVKEGTYDFTFKREGYTPESVRAKTISAREENVVEASLRPAVEGRGRVVRNGTGVDGVQMFAMLMSSDARTITGPDGSFILGGLAPGAVRLTIRKDAEFIQEIRTVNAPSNDVVIELPTGGRVTGRVVEKGSTKPIAQFQAGLSRSRSSGGMVMMAPPQLQSFTSDDGSFTLDNVPTGAHDLVATAPGFATGRMNVSIEEGKTLSDVVIELDAGTKLTGRVTGPTGAPLSDATVRLAMSPTSAVARMGSSKWTTSDANGEYVLDALEPGEETIEFTHPKYIATRKNVTLKGGELRLDAQLSGGQRVTGLVVTEAGAPVGDADVFASASGGSRRNARTNASGTFEFESLAPARYRFSATKSGYTEGVLDDFDISSGAPVRITLKTGGTIYGRVTGLSRDELSNAMVEARSGRNYASASVDATGNYKIEGAPTGTVQVTASVVSRALTGRRTTPTQTVEVDAGSTRQLDLEFRTDVAVTGRVTHNGMPVKGASINFSPRGGGAQTSGTTSTDEEGRYTITGLEDGNYNVMVIDVQRLNPYNTTYEVRGTATFNIDYETSSLRGRVVDAMNNEPIAGASVQLRTPDPSAGFGGRRETTSDANGVFIFDSIAPGSYVANATKDGFGNQTMDLTIGATGIDNLELKLARNDGVTLKVVDARDGRTLDPLVFVYDAQGRLVHEGRMMFFGGAEGVADTRLPLAAGTYTASVTSMGYAPRTVSFQSPSKQTVALTPGGMLIIESKHPTRLRVRLIDASGAPYPRLGTRPPSTDLNPSPGKTIMEHVAPGAYTLQLLGDNDVVMGSTSVVIREGQTTTAEI